MTAESARESGRIGVHVVHSVVGVSEIAELCVFESAESAYGSFKLSDSFLYALGACLRLNKEERHLCAETLVNAGKFRHGAYVVVAKLHVGGCL